MVTPPASCTARSPAAPSAPVPERTAATARSPSSAASEANSRSIDGFGAAGARLAGRSVSSPPSSATSAPAGVT